MNSNIATIPIIIIEPPGSKRIEPLIESLGKILHIEIIRIPAIMLSNVNFNTYASEIDIKKMSINIAKSPVLGEIGCALSHNVARRIISESSLGGVILEDDARILNTADFISTIRYFLSKKFEQDRVLGLLEWRSNSYKRKMNNQNQLKIRKLFGVTPTTVGYALSPTAAKIILNANSPIRFMPDWPTTDVTYYATSFGLIAHGDKSSQSLIELQNRNKISTFNKIKIYSLFYYFFNRKEFSSFANFLKIMIKPRLFWRLDSIKMFLTDFWSL